MRLRRGDPLLEHGGVDSAPDGLATTQIQGVIVPGTSSSISTATSSTNTSRWRKLHHHWCRQLLRLRLRLLVVLRWQRVRAPWQECLVRSRTLPPHRHPTHRRPSTTILLHRYRHRHRDRRRCRCRHGWLDGQLMGRVRSYGGADSVLVLVGVSRCGLTRAIPVLLLGLHACGRRGLA